MSYNHSSDKKHKAILMRLSGYSLGEIAQMVHISKSTASLWLSGIELDRTAKARINSLSALGRRKGLSVLRLKKKETVDVISSKSLDLVSAVDLQNIVMSKLICALLYWGEGGKTDNYVSFINSDHKMICVFLKLFRRSFSVDETKFRALIHIHDYHDEVALIEHWSNITGIPKHQFTKSYLKTNGGKTIRQNYKGTLKIKYFDIKIVLELKSIYNALAETLGV